MAEVLQLFREKGGPIAGNRQDLSLGKTYGTMPSDLVEVVRRKLKDKTYPWLEDRPA